jgi:hypothetical protein
MTAACRIAVAPGQRRRVLRTIAARSPSTTSSTSNRTTSANTGSPSIPAPLPPPPPAGGVASGSVLRPPGHRQPGVGIGGRACGAGSRGPLHPATCPPIRAGRAGATPDPPRSRVAARS